MNEYQSLRRRQGVQVQKTYELPDTETAELPKAKNILILEDDAALAVMLKEGLELKDIMSPSCQTGRKG